MKFLIVLILILPFLLNATPNNGNFKKKKKKEEVLQLQQIDNIEAV